MEEFLVKFTRDELVEIIADYYGEETQDVCVDDYTEDEIKEVILNKIM